MSEADQGRRNPAGRRRAIVHAAAELLVECGVGGLTHRKIAARAGVPLGSTTYYFRSLEQLSAEALRSLADGIDNELAGIAARFAMAPGDWKMLIDMVHSYLCDQQKIQADAAMYTAAFLRPELRPLALRWFDGLVAILEKYTDSETARNTAIFIDGAIMHAMLHERPLDAPALESVLNKLLQT